MSYSNPDPYNQPEAFGLEQLALLDFSDGSYCFDYRVVWRHKESGRFYTARDNGCSCPSPFEDYHSIDDLAAASFSELETEINEELAKARFEKLTPRSFRFTAGK